MYLFLQYPAQILYNGLLFCILGILFIRLYYTFNDSAFKIPKYEIYTFILLIITAIISCVISVISRMLPFPEPPHGIYLIIHGTSTLLSMILYVGLSVWLIYLFARKMYVLGQSIKLEQSGYKMDDRQLKLLYTTSKYISLLSIAILTTWASFILYFAQTFTIDKWTDLGKQMFLLQFCIDSVVNNLCLYLQYPWSQKYYKKCCKCCESFWLCILTAKVAKIHTYEDCIEQNTQIAHVRVHTQSHNSIEMMKLQGIDESTEQTRGGEEIEFVDGMEDI